MSEYDALIKHLEQNVPAHKDWAPLQGEFDPEAPWCHVYVIRVKPIQGRCDFDFYVGSTCRTVEERLGVHREGGMFAASIFKRRRTGRRARPGRICEELMLGTPPFPDRDSAVLGERVLANAILSFGYKVSSDMVDKTTDAEV